MRFTRICIFDGEVLRIPQNYATQEVIVNSNDAREIGKGIPQKQKMKNADVTEHFSFRLAGVLDF